MDDIIDSVAWCEKGDWFKRSYWIHADGTYSVDEYTDGNHEDIEESELPTSEHVEASWLDYSRHVAATGEDPLHEFMVARIRRRTESWHFRFAPSILGVVLTQAKRGRTTCRLRDLPQHALDYCLLDAEKVRAGKPAVVQGFANWSEFEDAVSGVKWGKWHHERLEVKEQRAPEIIARELRVAARRHIASRKKA